MVLAQGPQEVVVVGGGGGGGGGSYMKAGGSTSSPSHVDADRAQFLATWASPQDCQCVLVTCSWLSPK